MMKKEGNFLTIKTKEYTCILPISRIIIDLAAIEKSSIDNENLSIIIPLSEIIEKINYWQ